MRWFLVLIASVLTVSPMLADDAVVDLLRLAPKDTSFALVLRDFRGHAKRIGESPFAAWFPNSKLGKSLVASNDWTKLAEVEKTISDQLGVTSEQLVEEIFGDAIVFAYRSSDDSGLFLLKAPKPELLQKVLDRLNEAQKKSGEVNDVIVRKRGTVSYFERTRGEGRSEFYWVSGGTLAFSAKESHVLEAIDRAAKPGESPLVDALAKLKLNSAVVIGLFQPRTLDADLAAELATTQDANRKAFLKQFQRTWAACETMALSLEASSSLDLALNVVVNPKLLPEELRPILTAGGSSELWSAIPADALFATAGKLDAPKLLDAVRSFLSDEGKAALKLLMEDRVGPVVGKNKLTGLVQGLGPDIGFWIAAPDKESKGWVPVATFALKVGDPETKDGIAPMLLPALELVAQFIRIEYNRNHKDQIDFNTENLPGGDVKSLVNDALFPAGVRPSFGLRHGYLVISSSDAAVKGFSAPRAAPESAKGLVVRLSLAQLRRYLREREAAIVPAVAELTGAKPADLKTQFANFGDVLELFDSVELRRTGSDGLIRLVLSVKPAKPLSK